MTVISAEDVGTSIWAGWRLFPQVYMPSSVDAEHGDVRSLAVLGMFICMGALLLGNLLRSFILDEAASLDDRRQGCHWNSLMMWRQMTRAALGVLM